MNRRHGVSRAIVQRRSGRAPGAQGVVYVETLVALLTPIFFFFTIWQLVDLFTAQLILKHAAVVAVRAASVVGPDDPRFYGGQAKDQPNRGTRLDDVKSAAALVLVASPHFRSVPNVRVEGTFTADSAVTVTVETEYLCLSGWLNMVCGGQRSRPMQARAVFPYQGASFPYQH